MTSPKRRMEMDVMKLLMSDFEVSLVNDNMQEFDVVFHGPHDTLYENGVWDVHVELPDSYPYRSPSIGFGNRIFHPNIDELSGSVCLDVINQTWSPMYGLINIFDQFLPQLLRYPNPSDPLNTEAATLWGRDRQLYEQRVRECVEKYARGSNIQDNTSGNESEMSSLEDMSDDNLGMSD